MSVVIRLSRGGKKKHPCYRVVITKNTSRRDGGYIENIGFYHPTQANDENRVKINIERYNYWLSVGAKPSDRVALICKKLQS